eukprot:TRINITY_DN30514_c0_g1_i1.p1 TRINITY_DN30514_c0_g1~~TRINITY_DN30514_c0_g1_i1.p1  ORF type:complete len:408 (-),score=75.37 TRINITY_DN30514_c0_g1_i1:98-1321(-)
MAPFRTLAGRVSRHWAAGSEALRHRPNVALNFAGTRRHFAAALDPYKTLGLQRDATEADIKKAYRDKALSLHPDRNPDEKREESQRKFAEAASAYEILKDPAKRREYDLTGHVGGGSNGPGGPHAHAGGFPGGFHAGGVSQADAERLFREAFGNQGGLDQILQQLLQQQGMQMRGASPQGNPFEGFGSGPAGAGGFPNMGGYGGQPGRRPRILQVGMEVRVCADVESIHRASRRSNIDTENDERRARCAGKIGTITKADPKDSSVKVRVPVRPGRADEVWFGAAAVWDPAWIHEGMEVKVCPEVERIHEASREVGIDSDNDARRARCAGKIGTVVSVDHTDHSVKVRVPVLPGRADEVWFGVGALDPLSSDDDSSAAAEVYSGAGGGANMDPRTGPFGNAAGFHWAQ